MPDLEERLEKAAEILASSNYAVALTGAGVSVESGIAPFRGPGGLWTRYGEPPMDGYQRFLRDPKGWWMRRMKPDERMRERLATLLSAKPNPGHYALVELEAMGVLKCLITQNIDNLHRRAGSRRLVEIHGNVTLLRCVSCQRRRSREGFEVIGVPPRCPDCGGIVKSDTVMFGEPIPTDVLERCWLEVGRCDCMLVVGTSAKVYPAASFPVRVKRAGGTLIEVNLYESKLTPVCDVVLRGSSGEVLPLILERVKARVQKG
ncbi:MAG: NAD-dependent protein deacylase, partial [Candidatus Bathyarchaeia archaeon]